MAVKPIPDGYHSVTPYLIVNAGQRALDYYKQAFGASELFRMDAPGGKIGHAEIQIGDSRVMLSDENPAWGAKAPTPGVSTPVQLMIYVADVDATFKRRWLPVPRRPSRSRISFTVTGRERSRIRSATCGRLRPTSKTLQRMKCNAARRTT